MLGWKSNSQGSAVRSVDEANMGEDVWGLATLTQDVFVLNYLSEGVRIVIDFHFNDVFMLAAYSVC
ncbi:hypothetical protein DPMN_019199 [Dreissena polymorpha]|uniref:Uncharacterized protein n=1 Tax=Dreissena polymorpha TaxID=45954 RepID=A0A9D4NK98_DREPO|nr:hypothetical protein DPMN_019199 [Dreissena polymorpha]